MSVIEMKCIDQVLTFTNTPIVSAGNQNVDKVHFDFCPKWNGFIKMAFFFQQKDEMSYSLVNADNTCAIPNSIMKMSGRIYIAVTGVNTDKQIRTSTIQAYNIEDGILDVIAPEDFPGDESEAETFYNKIMEMCITTQNLHQDFLKNTAYIQIKDANEFEYTETMWQEEVRKYIDLLSEELTTDVKSVQTEFKQLWTNVVNWNTSTGVKIETAETSIEALENTVASIQEDILGLVEQLNELQSTYARDMMSLSSRITQLEDRIASMN